MKIPAIGNSVPRRGNLLTKALGRFLFFLSGWRVEGKFPNIPKFIIIFAPHTSWWDFLPLIASMLSMGFRCSWMMADGFFWGPMDSFWRWFGAVPIDRSNRHNYVEQLADQFKTSSGFILTISPEGIRIKVDSWKTGFYYIAKSADVPLLPVAVDYEKKIVGINEIYYTTDDIDTDMVKLHSYFEGITAKYPDQF